MNDGAKTQEAFAQAAGTAVETLAVWAEANQRVLRDLVELGSGTLREGVRLYADLQRTAIDAVRETQAAALRWQGGLSGAASDPSALYRQAVEESVSGAQRLFRLAEENALAMTRAAERMQAAAESAGKSIQETCASTASRLRELYAKA